MVRRFILDRGIKKSSLDISKWKTIESTLLSEKDSHLFNCRKLAIDSLISTNMTLEEIELISGIKKQNLYILFDKCLQTHPDGELFGYRALVPYKRIKKSNRINTISTILDEHPKLKKRIDSMILGKEDTQNSPREKAMSLKNMHAAFLKGCLQYGITSDNFPFILKDQGLKNFQNYANKLLDSNFVQSNARINNDAAHLASSTKKTSDSRKQPIDPLKRVEFDGHKIDAYFTMGHKMNTGEITKTEISRIWILAIIDVVTKCILGYYITLNPEYNSDDVIKTIQNSLSKWTPKHITIPGIEYQVGDGFPSSVIPEVEGARFQEFYLDNGLANKSNRVKDFIVNKLHSDYCLGPVANPTRRATVERFFERLEKELFHRLPSTTGSNPNDVKKQDPIQNAQKFNVKVTDIEQIIDVWIANYNNSPHMGIQNRTPLQAFQEHVDSGSLFTKYNEKELDELLLMETTRNINGSNKTGVRPYINFENVRYSSDILRQSTHLIGKKVLVKFNPDNISHLRMFLLDSGEEFGIIKAQGTWGEEPHSLRFRREVWKYGRNKSNSNNSEQIIESYNRYIAKKLKTNRKIRSKVENNLKLRDEMQSQEPDSVDKTNANDEQMKNDLNINISRLPSAFITKRR